MLYKLCNSIIISITLMKKKLTCPKYYGKKCDIYTFLFIPAKQCTLKVKVGYKY